MSCQFRVGRVKNRGYVTFESVAQKGLFIGMTPAGQIRPTVNTDEKNVCFFPEIVEYGRMKQRKIAPKDASAPVTARREEPAAKPVSPKPAERQASPEPEMDLVEANSDEFGEDDNNANAGDWRVWIQTIDTAIHGSVAVVAYGDQGSSGPISLGKTQEKGLFIAGHMDEFKVHFLY